MGFLSFKSADLWTRIFFYSIRFIDGVLVLDDKPSDEGFKEVFLPSAEWVLAIFDFWWFVGRWKKH
ncbi:hypothetical protein PanWU01x14_069810 [Parasponia andersonii]|uniref:Uncharacterized protein n=1 Tax=Parasponia andersonii TaxID=3476 RepID=A0A2P5DET1_PARAD|nr:hypothetical protein PanWU01x14_069810 [Parasponia andersonii]